MKKHILLGVALLSLMAASCSNDDVIDNGTEVVAGKTITLNAAINNGADTRLAYTDDGSSQITIEWSSSESFKMYKGKSSTISTFTNSADAKGTFKGDDIEGEGKYYAVYGDNITNTDGTLSIDLSGAQVGTNAENGIKEFMLACADALNSSTTLTFDHKLTVLKMTLTLPSDVEGPVNKVTVSGLHNKATYDLSRTENAYTYIDDNKGDITATNGKTGFVIEAGTHNITAYVAVFPESVTANQVTIKATVGDNEYSYTIASERTLPENMVVPVQVTLAAPVQPNFKSAYTKEDYKKWSKENCGSAPTREEMEMYLGAGVYWDDGAADGNQQTYTLPDGIKYHTGLWVKKKEYISGFSEGKASKTSSVTPTVGRPEDIGKYFFLPAAGGYSEGEFRFPGFKGYYWSSLPINSDIAYYLFFRSSFASVNDNYIVSGYLPMIAE